MKIKNETIEKIKEKLENAPSEEKSQAIVEAIQEVMEQEYSGVISQYQKEFEEYNASKENDKKFGLRTLTEKEKQWIDRAIKQEDTSSLKGNEIDYLPETTVDYIFEDLKTAHPLFAFIKWAPAGVQKWFLSERSGKATWGKLTRAIVDQIEAESYQIDK